MVITLRHRGMQLSPDSVGFHADADQVVGVEQVEGLGFGQGHLRINSNGVGWLRTNYATKQ